jgi:hypothetical protein
MFPFLTGLTLGTLTGIALVTLYRALQSIRKTERTIPLLPRPEVIVDRELTGEPLYVVGREWV